MSEQDFFREVEHTPVPWRHYELHNPLFYQDLSFMSLSILAPLEKIRSILPSKRLKPYRITHRQGVVAITAYQYRESDIGPYNEISIGVPVTIDKETPLFTGTIRKMPEILKTYSHHLPVTTEIAREVGAEFAGYPKFVADIKFIEGDDWQKCELRGDDQRIPHNQRPEVTLQTLPKVSGKSDHLSKRLYLEK